MITSYEVGAVFRVVDETTPVLERIARVGRDAAVSIGEVEKVLRSFSRVSLRSLTGQIERIGAASESMRGVVVQSLESVNAGLMMAARNARELSAAMSEIGVASRAMNIATAAGNRGGGGGRHGLHVSGMSARVPGGHVNFRGGGNLAMLAGGALAYGVYEEAQVEDIAARAMITGQIPVDSGMTQTEMYKSLRSVITRNAISGGFSPKEVGEAVLGSERQFAGLPFAKRMQVLDTMVPFAMQEARLKETPLKESAESLVGLAHMTGTYDVNKLPDLYRKFAYASQLTPKSLPEYTRALSYAMPSLVSGMGMDPDAIMFMTAMNQAAGIGSSKAGTWIQAFFSRLMPASGINLTRSQSKHNAALKAAGLLGEDGKPTWIAPGEEQHIGLGSLMKLSPLLGDSLAKMEPSARMTWLDGVFGKQGGREAGLMNLPEFIGQFPQLARQLKMAKGGDDVLKQYTEGSPVQQSRMAWSELTVVLMDLGTIVLPPLIDGLKSLRDILKGVSEYVPHLGGATPAVGGGVLKGAIAGAGVGWAIGAFGGPIGMAGGAAIGALGGGLWGGLEWLRGGKTVGNPWADLDASQRATGNAPPAVGTGGLAGSGIAANMVHAQNQQVTVKVDGDLSVNKESVVQEIAAALARMLSMSSEHNTGQGDGVLASPFTNGGGQ